MRLARWRRVEHDQSGRRIAVQFEQLLHRHVVGDAGERGRQIAVDAVGEDRIARGGRRRVALDQEIEGQLGVELERTQPRAAMRAESGERDRCIGSSPAPRPSASSRRGAGSTVITSTARPPWRR